MRNTRGGREMKNRVACFNCNDHASCEKIKHVCKKKTKENLQLVNLLRLLFLRQNWPLCVCHHVELSHVLCCMSHSGLCHSSRHAQHHVCSQPPRASVRSGGESLRFLAFAVPLFIFAHVSAAIHFLNCFWGEGRRWFLFLLLTASLSISAFDQ